MATTEFLLNMNTLETNLIQKHNELVRRLDAKYMDRINKLLAQKSMILMDLQRQFIAQRMKMKQRISKTQSNHNNIPSNRAHQSIDIYVPLEEPSAKSLAPTNNEKS